MNQINLYNGDCLEIMRQVIDKGVKVDTIKTDPSYNMTSNSWDSMIPLDKMWDCLENIKKINCPISLFNS